ncbi:MAG: hypothetical protein EPO21_15670 [Chloroflexota bacterium]|nr:MAG: hypothetical protein EPO21_15670 [Chloroflexota bacterium]
MSQEQINISREADYIVKRAQKGASHILRLGALVLFSTQSGDAWLLDTEDALSLCLARSGERQVFTIIESRTNVSIEWAAHYRIEGEGFVVIEQSGQVRTIFGYPIREILQTGRQAE